MRTFAELLIVCEEDRTLRVVLVGMLREAQPMLSHLRHRHSCRGDGPRDGRGIGRIHLSGHFESCSCRNDRRP
jgi:hypothetical protein